MRVIVISGTIQEFNGVRYYRCGRYFQRKGARLHRTVWEHFNGAVPEGHHVHHKDEDRGNNQPENLDCLPGRDHVEHHGKTGGHWGNGIAAATEAARDWHKSDAGREWHRQHYRDNCKDVLHAKQVMRCQHCGGEFSGRSIAKFCAPACKAKDFRQRHPGYSGRASGAG